MLADGVLGIHARLGGSVFRFVLPANGHEFMKANPMRNLVRIALMLTGLFLGPALCFAADPQRSVLVLDQSSIGLPFNTALATAIRLTAQRAKRRADFILFGKSGCQSILWLRI